MAYIPTERCWVLSKLSPLARIVACGPRLYGGQRVPAAPHRIEPGIWFFIPSDEGRTRLQLSTLVTMNVERSGGALSSDSRVQAALHLPSIVRPLRERT